MKKKNMATKLRILRILQKFSIYISIVRKIHKCVKFEVSKINISGVIHNNVKKYGAQFQNTGHSDLIYGWLLYGV